jgi:hypothetical protein
MHSTIDTRMLVIAQHAAQYGIGAMSLGEALTAVLVLDRSDWLHDRGFTIADALERIGPEWAACITEVARQLQTRATPPRLRFSFEIFPNDSESDGYMLRLLDRGREVGGGRFSAGGKSARFADSQRAYDAALAAGLAWLEDRQAQLVPELSH